MLNTMSIFYYGIEIKAVGTNLSFQELTGPVRVATLRARFYSLTQLASELQRALRSAGTQDYTVTVDRETRALTISAPANFSILIDGGPFNGSPIWIDLGLGDTNLTGSNSYTGSAVGKEFKPQFKLLDYVPLERNQRAIDATVNETGSGEVEVIRYGTKKLLECTVDFQTDIPQDPSGWIESNRNGVSKLVDFMEYIVKKAPVEFMADRDDKDTFVTLILESTSNDSRGLGFKVTEKANLPEYYTSGLLTFREVTA